MAKREIRSELGWSTADRITVRGKDLPPEEKDAARLTFAKALTMYQKIAKEAFDDTK